MAAGSDIRPLGTACDFCVRTAKWVPVVFILGTVGWSYYAYVVQLCLYTVPSYFEKIIYLVLYHFIFAIFMWSYWQTIFTPIGKVPKKFRLSRDDIQRLQRATSEQAQREVIETFAQSLPVATRTLNGAVRYCEKCHLVKPDRAHHCSVCGTCVLKMDHHCPWVNNCVSFTNYKHFVLFLAYSFLYCIFIVITSLNYFILFWKGELEGPGRFHILFLFFVAAMFATSLVSLFCYHCYLVTHNRSTLEAFRAPIFQSGPDKNGFSLGKYNNFQEVFGDNKALWFLPVFTSLGDGQVFPVRTQHESAQISNSFGDGITYPQRVQAEDTDRLLGGGSRWDEEELASTHSPLQN